jgi:sec-independent protein translocase protein TatB
LPVVGIWEMLVILLAVLMFGPKRIPQIARQIGKIVAQMRRSSDDFMRELTKEPAEDAPSPEPVEVPKMDFEMKDAPLTSEQIRDSASKLGIETEGRSDEEIRSEMMERIYASPVKEEE